MFLKKQTVFYSLIVLGFLIVSCNILYVYQNKIKSYQAEHVDSDIRTVLREVEGPISKTEHVDSDMRTVLREMEEPISETDFRHIFCGDLANKSTWEFKFDQISKRRFGQKYSELTSYDPGALNLDFFNPIGFDGNSMIMFEDYGAGVIHRVLFFPAFYPYNSSTEMDVLMSVTIDGKTLLNSPIYSEIQECDCPFKHPFFRPQPDKRHRSGYFFTFPVTYQHSVRISATFLNVDKLNEAEIWKAMKYCKEKNSKCPYKMYVGVTYNKFTHGAKLKTTFGDYFKPTPSKPGKNVLEEVNSAVSTMATAPEQYGPGMKTKCQLTCQNIPAGGEVTLFSDKETAKVIKSLLFRAYDQVEGKFVVSKHWDGMLLTMTWDGKAAQVKDIPLACLFLMGLGYVREVNSLLAGMRNKRCAVRGEGISIPDDQKPDWVAYLFYEMPFWKSARITVKRPREFGPAVICTEVTTKELNTVEYNPRLTGYFSAQFNQYDHRKPGHKTILKVENEWGHVVAVNIFIERVPAYRTVEQDIIIEVDDAKAPVMSGTGSEDFFGYVHSFRNSRNISHVLAGNPQYTRKRFDGKELNIVRAYRHMLLDPILFTKGVLIYFEEKCDRTNTHLSRARNFAEASHTFKFRPSMFFVAMFYGRKGPGGITTDRLDYGNLNSSNTHNVQYSPFNTTRFKIRSVFDNQPGIFFTRWIVSLKSGQRVKQTFKIRRKNAGVILRREYRSMVRNQKAKVLVDGAEAGTWFCPQGAVYEGVSLRINDHHLHPRLTVDKDTIQVTIEAITTWESSTIEVTSVIL